MSSESQTKGVAAVDRALAILAVFDGEVEPLTVSEIARRAGLYKSTALRLIASLKAFGYIIQSQDGRYHLGPSLLRLGSAYQRANKLEERILPVLYELVNKGSESPSFFIRHDADKRLCLFRIDSKHSTLDRVKTGQMLPLDKGAGGRVFKAFDGTGHGEIYDAIRANGYAVSFGETDPDCAAVAAPVFDFDGDILGVLSISGPLNRYSRDVVARQIELLMPAAEHLSRLFGGRSPAIAPLASVS